jgi:hypothetical protein
MLKRLVPILIVLAAVGGGVALSTLTADLAFASPHCQQTTGCSSSSSSGGSADHGG